MRNRFKRLEVILGAFMLIVCQNGVVQAKAEVSPAAEESVSQNETDDQGDTLPKEEENTDKTVTEEEENSGDEKAEHTETDASSTMAAKTENTESDVPENTVDEDTETKDSERTNEEQLQEVTDLKWSANGVGIFTNPNDHAFFKVEILKNGTLVHTWQEYYEPYGKEK